MLESTSPGFLQTDVYKYAKANNMPVEPLKPFTDAELLSIDMAQLIVLPKSEKRILEQKRDSPENHDKTYNRSRISRLTQPQ